jgi:hypothetical protein
LAQKELDIPDRKKHKRQYAFGGYPALAAFWLTGKPDSAEAHFGNLFERRIPAQKRSKQSHCRSLCILKFDLDMTLKFHLLPGSPRALLVFQCSRDKPETVKLKRVFKGIWGDYSRRKGLFQLLTAF